MSLTRRSFLSVSAAAPLLAQKNAPAQRPNIVLFLADDLGAWMTGCYGNTEIRTPNIDRLALSGVRFVNNIVASPAAPSSLASLLSGRPSGAQGSGLSEILAQAGYKCANAATPAQSLGFLDQQSKSSPFFLTLAYPKLSGPMEGIAAKYTAVYKSATFDTFGIQPAAPNAAAGKEALKAPLEHIRATAAAVSALDDQLAAVQKKLIEKGFFDNTILIFTSLTGSLLGRHGLWGDGLASEPPNMFDEVVQVPMIWQWPGRVPVESSRPEVVSHLDFLPTLCDALSLKPPALSGRSYLPLLQNRRFPKKQPWHNTAFGQLRNVEMARDNYYKLVLREQGKAPGEFYDLRKDPRERVNRYDDPGYVTPRDTLAREIAAWHEKHA